MEVPNISNNRDEEIVYSPNKYRETEGMKERMLQNWMKNVEKLEIYMVKWTLNIRTLH